MFGRLRWPDPRDAHYSARRALPPLGTVVLPTTPVRWDCGPVLNQGRTQTCVGHAARAWLSSDPGRRAVLSPTAFDLYAQAQALDEWAPMPHEGSSVRAVMRALVQDTFCSQYLWAVDNAPDAVDVLRAWVMLSGPSVVGTNWYSSMFTPSPGSAVLSIDPSASVVGGHAWIVLGYDPQRACFRMQNSWGAGWADGGQAWVPDAVMARLIREDGEASMPTEVPLVPPPVTPPPAPPLPVGPPAPAPTA